MRVESEKAPPPPAEAAWRDVPLPVWARGEIKPRPAWAVGETEPPPSKAAALGDRLGARASGLGKPSLAPAFDQVGRPPAHSAGKEGVVPAEAAHGDRIERPPQRAEEVSSLGRSYSVFWTITSFGLWLHTCMRL